MLSACNSVSPVNEYPAARPCQDTSYLLLEYRNSVGYPSIPLLSAGVGVKEPVLSVVLRRVVCGSVLDCVPYLIGQMAAGWSGTDAAPWPRRQWRKSSILWSGVVVAALAPGTVLFCFAQSEEAFVLMKGNGEETGSEDLRGYSPLVEDGPSPDESPSPLLRTTGRRSRQSQRGLPQTVERKRKFMALSLFMVSAVAAAAAIREAVKGRNATVAAPGGKKTITTRIFFLIGAAALAAFLLSMQYRRPRERLGDEPVRVESLPLIPPTTGVEPSVILPTLILTVASLVAAVVVGAKRRRGKSAMPETVQPDATLAEPGERPGTEVLDRENPAQDTAEPGTVPTDEELPAPGQDRAAHLAEDSLVDAEPAEAVIHPRESERTPEERMEFEKPFGRLEIWALSPLELPGDKAGLAGDPGREMSLFASAFASRLKEGAELVDQLQAVVDNLSRMSQSAVSSRLTSWQMQDSIGVLESAELPKWFSGAVEDLKRRKVLSPEQATEFEERLEEITARFRGLRNALEEIRSAGRGAPESTP